ncbi:MAG TPA: permease [Bacilli bacterium]
MQTSFVHRWGMPVIALICLVLIFFILNREFPNFTIDMTFLQNFKTIFLSIILEAIPFVLLGVLVAALLQIFVSEETVRRFVPKHPLLGILFGCFLGVLFPLCECGMIPIVRRLILKGMPVYVGVVYIIAGPILNPVVFSSTYMAFRSHPEVAYGRMGLALIVSIVIGLILYRFVKSNPLRQTIAHNTVQQVEVHDHSHSHVHNHDHHHNPPTRNKSFTALGHASDEFFEMGKYLIFGAMITALIQTMMNRDVLVSIGDGAFSSHLFMMGLAYIMSLCSTSDAFVASSFWTTFSAGSLLTFLVYGPMLDFKNTLMLLAVFRAKFVFLLIGLISVVVLAGSLLYSNIFL